MVLQDLTSHSSALMVHQGLTNHRHALMVPQGSTSHSLALMARLLFNNQDTALIVHPDLTNHGTALMVLPNLTNHSNNLIVPPDLTKLDLGNSLRLNRPQGTQSPHLVLSGHLCHRKYNSKAPFQRQNQPLSNLPVWKVRLQENQPDSHSLTKIKVNWNQIKMLKLRI